MTFGPLAGLRVIEVAGIGPAPFCGMLLADLGADVVVVDRPPSSSDGFKLAPDTIINRGKRMTTLDLKSDQDVGTFLKLIENCDALIEGMRPGVMERLGLGPEVCIQRNARLVYGRMTGWGQTGPLSQAAGHDINYIALSGALWYSGQAGDAPMAPPSLIGDIGGGALYLAVGVLAAVTNAKTTGKGQIVDAAIVDGSAHMTNLLLSLRAAGQFVEQRGESLLDGPHWYATYRCLDGHFVSLGSVEPKFYALLLDKLGLTADPDLDIAADRTRWPDLRQRFSEVFAGKTREEWCNLLEGTDACFAPVLDPLEASTHPHMVARGVYQEVDGVLQAMPAPRFSATPVSTGESVPMRRLNVASIFESWA
ncbi:CaiB/BaiF CoA-transferase family protein [Brevundimonas sp.]|uniref:CaiB/BaiF CoA transferase family protein n=1 Tax=Brevundimonas sp. TaxID=1871086 RepID=UPI001A1857DE|nr:CaiB/BaiF CoA-transferase family protein [Brevundimonas sp.]MBJ7483873.1 CoA transferase [Brevundimonas sp.]